MSLNKKTKYLILFILTSIFLGYSLSFLSIFGWMRFAGLFILVTLVLVVTFISDMMSKKSNSKYVLVVLGVMFFAGLFGISIHSNQNYRKETKANAVIIELNDFQKQNDSLPIFLEELSSTNTFSDLNYKREGAYFRLDYSLDGWHHCTYQSKDSEWYCGD